MTIIPEQKEKEPEVAVIEAVSTLELTRLIKHTWEEGVVQKIAAGGTAADMGDGEAASNLLNLAINQMRAIQSLLEQAKNNPTGKIEVPISNKYLGTPIIALDQLVTPTNNQ